MNGRNNEAREFAPGDPNRPQGLALGCGVGERIELTTASGERIVLHLLKARDNQARIAFNAPKSVQILRGKVKDRDAKVA